MQILKLKSLLKEDDDKFIQIQDLPLDSFVQKFKSIASDSKVQSVISAGLTDGKPQDEKITFTSKMLSAKDLVPTQNEIGQNESLVNILNDKYNSLQSFLDGSANFSSPIVVLNDKYIIDGHHRWSQAYIANPNVMVPTYSMTADLTPEKALKAVHIAIAADTQQLPLSSAKGINLYSAGKDAIVKTVNDNLTDKATKLYQKYGAGKDVDAISSYIWSNVQSMQQNNKPISGAPSRSAMPQTGDSPKFDDLLSKGIVNFKDARKTDVKKESRIRLKDLIK